jgi:hypothetical protein
MMVDIDHSFRVSNFSSPCQNPRVRFSDSICTFDQARSVEAKQLVKGIGDMLVSADAAAIQLYLETNGRPVLRRAQNHMEVAAVESEYNPAGRRSECATLGAGVPRSAESPLI